jgi:hypothetical protein
MPKRSHLRILLICFFGVFFRSPAAHAWPYYFEFGGTMASFTTPGPLLLSQGKASSSSASSGYGIPLTLGVHLQEHQHGILFALALQARYISATSGAGDSFTTFPVSPMLRVEFWRIVFGAGYTKLVYDGLGFKRGGAIDSVLTLETQFLFPITPEIDFGLQASRESYSSASLGNGPAIMEYGAFFRLNFGMSDAISGERRKFKGWRYPYGSPLRK